MAKLTIDTGTAGNPATGDTLRTAMTKVNANFTEIYNELGSDGTFSNISFAGNTISTDDTNGDLTIDPNGTGRLVIDATITNTTTNSNIKISPNGTGALDVDTSRIINVTDPTSAQDAATKNYVDTQLASSDHNFTFVGDDSTGTAVTQGETFKFAGTQNITTAVSGDTLTITGPDLSSYATTSYVDAQNQSQALTFVGDDSSGTAVNSGETFKIAGTQNVTTAVSGDTLTITGPDLSSYLTDNGLGDLTVTGSTISSPSNADLTLTTSGTGSVSIEAIQIKGTELSSTDSTQITVKEDLKVTGTTYTNGLVLTSEYGEAQITSQHVTANELRTNEIKSRGSNADINIDPEGTGRVVAKGALEIQKGYIEAINTLTSSSTITVDFSTASVHTVTLAENTQFVVTNLPTGGTGTIIITQDGGGSNTGSFGTDGSTAVKFAGGTPTLSTAGGAIDVVTVFNDGTNYLGNIAKAYA